MNGKLFLRKLAWRVVLITIAIFIAVLNYSLPHQEFISNITVQDMGILGFVFLISIFILVLAGILYFSGHLFSEDGEEPAYLAFALTAIFAVLMNMPLFHILNNGTYPSGNTFIGIMVGIGSVLFFGLVLFFYLRILYKDDYLKICQTRLIIRARNEVLNTENQYDQFVFKVIQSLTHERVSLWSIDNVLKVETFMDTLDSNIIELAEIKRFNNEIEIELSELVSH